MEKITTEHAQNRTEENGGFPRNNEPPNRLYRIRQWRALRRFAKIIFKAAILHAKITKITLTVQFWMLFLAEISENFYRKEFLRCGQTKWGIGIIYTVNGCQDIVVGNLSACSFNVRVLVINLFLNIFPKLKEQKKHD